MPALAMQSHEPGGPETLVLTRVPMPEPGPGEVRVAIRTAAVNFPDTLIIRDLYQFRPDRPFAPGAEIAGIVDAVGPGVTSPAPGTRVLAMTIHGGFATHVAIPAVAAVPIPDAMPFDEAAALVFTYATCLHALTDRGQLAPGETLLVLGASGGIGAAAVDLGLAMDARVIAAVSSPEKAAEARAQGAHQVLIYPRRMDGDAQRSLGAQIKAAAAALGGEGAGVDVALDPVGGDYAEPALRAMAWNGRYLVVGFPAGIPKIPLNLPLLKGCAIVGVFLGAFARQQPARFAEHRQTLLRLYEERKIRPRISARFPLEQAADALRLIETRQARGKIVLTMP